MIRLLAGAGLLLWIGTTVLLSGWRRLARPPLASRLAPFAAGRDLPRIGVSAAGSLGQLVASVAETAGDRLARTFGVEESAAVRLRRIHAPLDVTAFRTRQLAWSGAALGAGLLVAASGAPVVISLLCVLGAPLLAFLMVEQRLARASARWQQQLARELPVVAEQLAMLLNAGYSIGASINRLAGRGVGCCARDLLVVANRVKQGVSEKAAFREWGELAGVEPLDRLVAVLALDAEASDLGRLVSAEARHARRELHRSTVEVVERRAQQVWIPVSVATLVPGVILLAVPFLAALRLFANA